MSRPLIKCAHVAKWEIGGETPERQAHNTQVLVLQPLWYGLREVAWFCVPSSLPAVLGLNQIFVRCHRGSGRGHASGAGSQIPSPNTSVCTLMIWKRKPTEINIDISRVMKQLRSWFINDSPHFETCLHRQRGEQAGEARVGRCALWLIFRGAFCSISSFLREAGVVWLRNILRHLKWGGLPQTLQKAMLKSESQAWHSFSIQSTFSSLLKRSSLVTPLAWLVA